MFFWAVFMLTTALIETDYVCPGRMCIYMQAVPTLHSSWFTNFLFFSVQHMSARTVIIGRHADIKYLLSCFLIVM